MTSEHLYSSRQVLYSFYITQFLILTVGVPVLWWQGKLQKNYFSFDSGSMWILGLGAAALILLVEAVLIKWFPQSWMDDGGINRLLFKDRSLVHILVISFLAATSEEILFRGVLQEWLGIWVTSVLFVLLHTRYLRKWLLVTVVFFISIGLGFLAESCQDLAPVIIAHSLVDFILGCYLRFCKLKHEL
ncbi:CPBP family intramembrane glutamic endopeptidase [Thermoactinomyces mirandus]|uniref:CPBP family intramembrane metalloprotease n=1 Tax=Thermoactinomyces mirandus TaxID=2756294 RepID=A0A7W1XUV5_9BACL|nr:CPBP family intramembrane glutamic endopeptidase [Thermoactinomyces mirandus]MBA4603714.1 CPBP family intramembrane metalloprotease [Thermoactinomyces mirandus]